MAGRDGTKRKHILRQEHNRTNYRYAGVTFERPFQLLFVREFFSNQWKSINWCPKSLQSNLSLRPPDKSDQLKIADTQFQFLEFTDSNVRSAFLKMRPPEKCKLRTPKVGPKRRSNLQKATTYVKLSEKHSFDCLTFPSQALRTSDHRVCKVRLARPLPNTPPPPLTRGNHRSLVVMSWLAQGHVHNSILKFFEPNLANETTWKIGPLTRSPFGGRNSQIWLYFRHKFKIDNLPEFRTVRHHSKKGKVSLTPDNTDEFYTFSGLVELPDSYAVMSRSVTKPMFVLRMLVLQRTWNMSVMFSYWYQIVGGQSL